MIEQSERLELAARLRELADHSSEAELRSSLSRSYYAIYHAARELGEIGFEEKIGHHNIAGFLGMIEPQIKESVEEFQRFRVQADYDETLVRRKFGENPELFRTEVMRQLEEGRLVFRRIILEIEKHRSRGV